MYFTSISLCSGCCCGADNVEAPTEQSISVGVSQTKNPKAAGSSQKSHPCESCGPVLRDIFHLVEQQGTQHSPKLLRCGACAKRFYVTANFHQQQEPHTREKPSRSHVDRVSLAELQFPCVPEAFYLQGDWEELSDLLRPSPARGRSHQGQAK